MPLLTIVLHSMGSTDQLLKLAASTVIILGLGALLAIPLLFVFRRIGWDTRGRAYRDALAGLWAAGFTLLLVALVADAGWLPEEWDTSRLTILAVVVCGGVWRLRRPEASRIRTWVTAATTVAAIIALSYAT